MANHFPITITINSAAVVIMATGSSLCVKCIDHAMPEKVTQRTARDLEEAYGIAADLLKERLKDHVEADVDRTIRDHRNCADGSAT